MGEIKDKISKVESGNNYKAVNKASNASGKYQFVKSTWEGLGYNWADRFNPQLQEEAMAKLTALNKNTFVSKFKTEPTDSDLYGMHFLGTAGYSKVKQADPNTPISELIKGQAYNLNKNVFEKNGRPITVSEFNGWLTKKMGTGVSQVGSQEQPQAGYVGMLPNGLPDVYGQPYVAEEKVKEEETAEAPKRTDNANKLGFVADYEELAKQYEQQLQAQQKPILQQEIVEGVQYQPIQQNFQEGGYFFQKGGTWEKQQARMKAEKDAKLKALLAQEKPVYKKKTIDEKLAEKKAQENTKTVQKDNTTTKKHNDASKHSTSARNKTDKEIAEERQARIDAQAKANEQPFDWSNFRQSLADRSQATGDALRISNEPNFFDDYLNPATMIGSMADNLGQAPLRAEQTDSYIPYVTAIGTPLAVGAVAGIGTQNTGQFVNNLANPLAGTGDLVNNLGNKYLPNASKLNPYAFKASEDMGYRMLGKEGYQDAIESGVLRAKPTPNQPVSGGISLTRNTNRNPNTGKMQGALDRPYFADGFIDERYAADYMAAVSKADNNLVPIPTHKGIAPAQAGSIPLENAIIYKKDWLQGYKQVEAPKYQLGGIKIDPQGYWNPDNEGKPVIIPNTGSITMRGVDYPIYGKSLETGEVKLMTPNNNYFFANTQNVLEQPINFQIGGEFVEIDRGNGKIEKINTDSDEYRALYGEGRVLGREGDTLLAPKDLNEVTITAFRKTKPESLEPKVQIDEQELQQRLDNPYNFETQKDATSTVKEEILPEVKAGQKLPNKEEIKDLASTYKTKEELLDIEAEKLLARRQELFNNRSNDLNPEEDLEETLDISKLKTKEEVLKVQKRLDELGYNLNPKGIFENDGMDGKLGNVTKKAIETYNQTKAKNIYSSYKEGEGLLGKCTEKQCSEYAQNEIFRNFKPSVKREIWNEKTGLYGDAWTIGNHIEQAGGKKVQKVQPGDAVTMYTGGASSYLGEAKKHGTDATHIGIVDKVNPDGSYYILHNVHEGSRGDYEGREYRDLIKDGKIVSGGLGRSFEIRGSYRPNYDAIKEYEKKSKVREDVSLTIHPKKLEELQALNKSYTGANIQKNVNELMQPLNNINNKKVMTQKHGLTEEEYQSIAKLSLGILAQESGFGTSNKLLPKEIAAKTLEIVGLRGEASEGAGQIKYKTNYGDSDLTEFGINEGNFDENDKTPLVVADRIATYYRQLIKKGETKESALYKAVEKYNRGSNTKYADSKDSDYVNKVVNFSELFLVQDKKGKSYNTTTDKLLLEKQVAKKKVAKQ